MSFHDDSGASDVSYDGLAFNLALGGLINPRLGIGVEIWGVSSDQTDDIGQQYTIYQRNIGPILRWWASPRWWLQGGAGTARAGSSASGASDSVPGVSVQFAGGWEALSAPTWAIDFAARLTLTGYHDTGGPSLSSSDFALTGSFAWF
jgi:hypothetical protein